MNLTLDLYETKKGWTATVAEADRIWDSYTEEERVECGNPPTSCYAEGATAAEAVTTAVNALLEKVKP